MVVLLGMELVFGAAAAGALRNTETGRRVIDAAKAAAAAASSLVYDDEADEAATDPNSPYVIKQRLRSLHLPQLRGPPGIPPDERVLCGFSMLEQLASAVPRRFGDVGGAWHMLFSTALQGRSLAHLPASNVMGSRSEAVLARLGEAVRRGSRP